MTPFSGFRSYKCAGAPSWDEFTGDGAKKNGWPGPELSGLPPDFLTPLKPRERRRRRSEENATVARNLVAWPGAVAAGGSGKQQILCVDDVHDDDVELRITNCELQVASCRLTGRDRMGWDSSTVKWIGQSHITSCCGHRVESSRVESPGEQTEQSRNRGKHIYLPAWLPGK